MSASRRVSSKRRPLETCLAIPEPHVCCNGPRDCGGTSDWCSHCAPGAFDEKGNYIDFEFDDDE